MLNSKVNTKLQTSWDASSLRILQTCPYKYYLQSLNGWRKPYNVHLDFGTRYHDYRERYYRAYMSLGDKEAALVDTVRAAMLDTWGWETGDTKKCRKTLIRALVWAAEEWDHPPISGETLEVSFGIPLGIKSPYDEEYMLCGHLDRQAEVLGDASFIEMKTTGDTLSSQVAQRWAPDIQVSIYACASDVIWDAPYGYIELMQVAVGFCRFMLVPIRRLKSLREETWKEVKWWIKLAEQCAEAGYWPRNESACGHYGGCDFRKDVCSSSPDARQGVLEANFVQDFWDPTEVR